MKRFIQLALLAILLCSAAQAQQTVFVPNCAGSNDTAKFSSFITIIGSNTGTIRLPYKGTSRCVVTDLTIPANVTLDNSDGTGISRSGTLTILGPVVNPPGKRLFYGAGTTTFSGNTSITALYPQWWGTVGTGLVDDTTPWNAFIVAVNEVHGVGRLTPRQKYLLSSGATISTANGFTLTSGVDARNFNPNAPQLIWNGTGGTMLSFGQGQNIVIEGIYFKTAAGKSIDSFIKFDGDPTSQIGTGNSVRYFSMDALGQSNASAKLISVCPTCTQNHENYYVGYGHFYCSNAARASAAGTAVFNGNSANAKHQLFEHLNPTNCAVGVDITAGSAEASYIGGGSNGIGVRFGQGTTEPSLVDHYTAEADLQAIVVAVAAAPVAITNGRFSNTNQTNTGGFIKVSGLTSITNGRFENAPPSGGILVEDGTVGTPSEGSMRLDISDTQFPDVTMAQVGLNQWATANGSTYRICPSFGITDAGGKCLESAPRLFNQTVGAGILAPFEIRQVWPTGTTDIQTGLKVNVTDVGTSAAGSPLLDLLAGGVSKFQVNKNGQAISTLATGTAPLVVASTTKVSNLNADKLDGQDFADPGVIGGGTPAAITGTTVIANTSLAINGGTALTTTNRTGTGNLVLDTKPTIGLLIQGEGAVLSVSSNTIAPTATIHHVGAGLIKTITVPAGFTSGTLFLIPDAAFTYDNTGNILVPGGGGTATINRVMSFTWSSSSSKWTPSY